MTFGSWGWVGLIPFPIEPVDVYSQIMGSGGGTTVFTTSTFVLDEAAAYVLVAVDDSVGIDATTPTVTGFGLTWNLETSFNGSGDTRVSVFSASGTPTATGAITVTKNEASGATMGVSVVALDGVNPANPVNQAAVTQDFASSSVAFALGAFASPNNQALVFGAVMSTRSPSDYVFTGGFTAIPGSQASGTGLSGAHDMAVAAAFADAKNDGAGGANAQIVNKLKWAVAVEMNA